ncbi:receptor-like protein 56 isoform X2 [Corylus avellana]|uniref:receptor-like protein 56 isoform X2 n=1 Tax=Corylus avellana TaxID=13451 RepID=UPI00286A04BE|nr:receptor-like protein 56 isoform X2 [Corylus avellana]
MLVPLKELKSLNLSANSIGGCLPNEGFEKMSSLRNLRILDLGYNYFDNTSIPQSLGAVTSLETLILTENKLQGYFPAQELIALRNLNKLDISWNYYNGSLPLQGFERLVLLPKLEILNLGYNSFDCSIIPSLSGLASLNTLSLRRNYLGWCNTTTGFESLSRLENLETLDLSDNNLNRSIIESLSAIKSLKNLNLKWNEIRGSFPIKEISAFANLEKLDLSDNKLNGSQTIQGSESLSRLENLETLDLSANYFDKSIIESLSAVKSLKNLNLAWNFMGGSFPAKELSAFENLEKLDLSGNNFDGPLTIQGLSNSRISPYIGALSSLKAISLAYNSLNGTLPKDLCSLKKLQELDLYGNLFEGILPTCLNNLTSLRLLDISRNRFVGNISSYLIASLTSLEYIDLSYNQFEGLFQFNIFANHSKLKAILLASENNKLEIETEISAGWDFSFQLMILVLSNCNLNKLTGNIPKLLLDQRELEIIDLSHNNLNGSFPIWLIENNTRLRKLNLQNNSFMGKFHLPPNRCKSILYMDVSDNHLGGQLQENIGKITPNLKYLNLSRNHFEGYPPSSIVDKSHLLQHLDLSFNDFSGKVPTKLIASRTNLFSLKLCNNQFTGFDLPAAPSKEFGWSEMRFLDISNNKLSGMIPRWIGNMTSLQSLVVSNNSFEGQIPCGLPNSLQLVDLSHNSLSGSLPSCLNLQNIEHLYLQGNKLTGPIPKSIFNSSSLLTLDLRDNNFFGSIPYQISAPPNLRILLMGGNNFSGIIPNQLCWLKKIGLMDLSKNSLFGTIPHCFHNMSFGKLYVKDFLYGSYSNHSIRQFLGVGSTFETLNIWNYGKDYINIVYGQQVAVEFVTKYRSNSYHGDILNYMSGLDLSCNKLTGRIPQELGKLSSIHALNLSHNQLTGSIPQTFSNLTKLESLDLSHNKLSGKIPSELIDLYSLEVFTVAYNNLSGKLPDMKAQFGTFEKSCYEGNPFLCGEPLDNNCTSEDESHPSPAKSSNASEGQWYEVDPQVFFASFIGSYIIFFLGVACLLYIHPYWQQRCVNLIEDLKYRCYYPVFDTLKRLSNCLES